MLSSTSIHINWNPQVSESFKLEVYVDGDFYDRHSSIIGFNFTVTRLPPASEYTFFVSSLFDDDYESSVGASVTVNRKLYHPIQYSSFEILGKLG